MPRHGMKYRRYHKVKVIQTPAMVNNPGPGAGRYVVRVLESARMTKVHFESIRRAVRRCVRRNGKLIFPNAQMLPITGKPAEIRMGKGKGAVDYWAMRIPAGTPVATMRGLFWKKARAALFTARTKLPVRSIVTIKAPFMDWDDFIDLHDVEVKSRALLRRGLPLYAYAFEPLDVEFINKLR